MKWFRNRPFPFLWALILFAVLCAILLWGRVISFDLFFSVFAGTILAYVSSLAIAGQTEKSEQEQIKKRQSKDRQKVLNLVLWEIKENANFVKEVRQYIFNSGSMSVNDFNNKKRNVLLERFQSHAKEAVWQDVLHTLAEAELIEAISNLYRDFIYCNRSLDLASSWVATALPDPRKITVYNAGLYKGLLSQISSQPWGNQFFNAISQLESACGELIPKLEKKFAESTIS